MKGILKFERDFLGDKPVRVNKKHGDTSYVIHRHDYYEIILYTDCAGVCVLNGTEYKLADNQLFFLSPNDFHRIAANNTESSSSIVISFSETAADSELIKALGFSARVSFSPSEETVKNINLLYEYFVTNGEYKEIKLKHLLNIILCNVLENSTVVKNKNSFCHPAVGKAMSMILTDVSKSTSLDEIAKKLNLSPSYFSDLFKKETGRSFSKWLREIRIEHAKRLLEENEISVLDVGFECGYETPSQFIKMFKRETGATPSAYRKEFKSLSDNSNKK